MSDTLAPTVDTGTGDPAEAMFAWWHVMLGTDPLHRDLHDVLHVFGYNDVCQVLTDPGMFSSDDRSRPGRGCRDGRDGQGRGVRAMSAGGLDVLAQSRRESAGAGARVSGTRTDHAENEA